MLRIGVIGSGNVARKYYLPGLNDPERGIVLEAVCDVVPSRAETIARDFGAQHVYTDHRRMLAEANLDIVWILTAVATHAPLVRDTLHAGRDVFTEKPLAMNRREADELVALSQETGRAFLSAPVLMIYPDFQWTRDIVRAGAAGGVTFARARSSHGGANRKMWATDSGNFFRKETAGETPPLYDMGVYALNYLTNVLGSVKRVSAMAGTALPERTIDKVAEPGFVPYTMPVTVPDNVALLLDFGDACFATVDASFAIPYQDGARFEFHGYEGAVYWSPGEDPRVISERPEYAAPDAAEPVAWHTRPLPEERRPERDLKWGQLLSRHIVECRAEGKRPLCGADHARHVVEIMERAQDAIRTGRVQEMESEAAPAV